MNLRRKELVTRAKIVTHRDITSRAHSVNSRSCGGAGYAVDVANFIVKVLNQSTWAGGFRSSS